MYRSYLLTYTILLLRKIFDLGELNLHTVIGLEFGFYTLPRVDFPIGMKHRKVSGCGGGGTVVDMIVGVSIIIVRPFCTEREMSKHSNKIF